MFSASDARLLSRRVSRTSESIQGSLSTRHAMTVRHVILEGIAFTSRVGCRVHLFVASVVVEIGND